MDPIVALGLASNVVQFIQYASDLIKTTAEIRRSSSGCPANVRALDDIYGRLKDLGTALSTEAVFGADLMPHQTRDLARGVSAVKELSLACKRDCQKLLDVVGELRHSGGSAKPGCWQSFRMALQKHWKQPEIAELEARLTRTQVTMTLHICTLAR